MQKILVLVLLLGFSCAQAAVRPSIVVDSSQCTQLKRPSQPFVLVLKQGQDLINAVLSCANQANLKSASISGIGAVDNPTLAYYNLDTKQYQHKTFAGSYQLISLDGNLAQENGKTVSHLHAAMSGEAYQLIGGHLSEAFVGATAELIVTPLKGTMQRQLDKTIGLKLLTPR